jgi:hypothetical protein
MFASDQVLYFFEKGVFDSMGIGKAFVRFIHRRLSLKGRICGLAHHLTEARAASLCGQSSRREFPGGGLAKRKGLISVLHCALLVPRYHCDTV